MGSPPMRLAPGISAQGCAEFPLCIASALKTRYSPLEMGMACVSRQRRIALRELTVQRWAAAISLASVAAGVVPASRFPFSRNVVGVTPMSFFLPKVTI